MCTWSRHRRVCLHHINPLVLILGDELFARLNLPRPAPITSAVRDQLARQIHAMSAAERLTAAKTLDSHISALEEVREQLRTYEPAIANRHSID